jgi:hypothetical protein
LNIVNVMAAVSIAVCWLAFAVVWLITAISNQSRAPAQRQRSWYGTRVLPVVIISTVVRLAVPRAHWQSVTFYAPWARFLGLAILVAATVLTLWARTAEFPEDYPRYRRRVPQLLPGTSRSSSTCRRALA